MITFRNHLGSMLCSEQEWLIWAFGWCSLLIGILGQGEKRVWINLRVLIHFAIVYPYLKSDNGQLLRKVSASLLVSDLFKLILRFGRIPGHGEQVGLGFRGSRVRFRRWLPFCT